MAGIKFVQSNGENHHAKNVGLVAFVLLNENGECVKKSSSLHDCAFEAVLASLGTSHSSEKTCTTGEVDLSHLRDKRMNKTILLRYTAGYSFVLLVVLRQSELSCEWIRKSGGQIAVSAKCSGTQCKDVVVDVDGIFDAEQVTHLAYGVALRSYNFDLYKKNKRACSDVNPKALSFTFYSSRSAEIEQLYKPYAAAVSGVFLARDYVSEPPNVLYPLAYAERLSFLEAHGVSVEVLRSDRLKELGMHSLLGVGYGSRKESVMVILRWNGGARTDKITTLVGKGVTFDSGGLSLKPADSMEDMKTDMAGSAVVAGTIYALALMKAPVNVVGIMALVENMPDGAAQRPGDVVESMSGQTIEVLNTDAEGRLILADALWYASRDFSSSVIIDLATLTGAVTVALGDYYAGLYSNDDSLVRSFCEAAEKVDEPVWPLPLHEHFDRRMDSAIADIRNTSTERGAGSITAAQFLQRFVMKGIPWVHLDIAGVAWKKSAGSFHPKGATGYGVALLLSYFGFLGKK